MSDLNFLKQLLILKSIDPYNESTAGRSALNEEDLFLINARKREEALKIAVYYITKIAVIVTFNVLVVVFSDPCCSFYYTWILELAQ